MSMKSNSKSHSQPSSAFSAEAVARASDEAWLAVHQDLTPKPPPGSKTIAEVSMIWGVGMNRTARRLAVMVCQGKAKLTKIGHTYYYSLTP